MTNYQEPTQAFARYDMDLGILMVGGGATKTIESILHNADINNFKSVSQSTCNLNGWGEIPEEKRTAGNFICQATYYGFNYNALQALSHEVTELQSTLLRDEEESDDEYEGRKVKLTVEQGLVIERQILDDFFTNKSEELDKYSQKVQDITTRLKDTVREYGTYDFSVLEELAPLSELFKPWGKFELDPDKYLISLVRPTFTKEYQGTVEEVIKLQDVGDEYQTQIEDYRAKQIELGEQLRQLGQSSEYKDIVQAKEDHTAQQKAQTTQHQVTQEPKKGSRLNPLNWRKH